MMFATIEAWGIQWSQINPKNLSRETHKLYILLSPKKITLSESCWVVHLSEVCSKHEVRWAPLSKVWLSKHPFGNGRAFLKFKILKLQLNGKILMTSQESGIHFCENMWMWLLEQVGYLVDREVGRLAFLKQNCVKITHKLGY